MSRQPIPFKNSISTRLLKVVFGLYFVITLIVTCIQLLSEYWHVKENVFHELQGLQKTFEAGIAETLWSYNDDQLASILFGMQNIEIVLGVKIIETQNQSIAGAVGEILDDNGKRVFIEKNGEQQPVASGRLFTELFDFTFPIYYHDENGRAYHLGQGTIYTGNQIVIDRIQYGFILILTNAVIKTGFLWFIFLFFVRRIVGTPLEMLTTATEQLDPQRADSLQNSPNLLNSRSFQSEDELEVLAKSFEKMRLAVLDKIQQLESLNQTLELKVEERTLELRHSLETQKQQHAQLENQHQQLQHTQIQLVQSEKMASLGTLVAGVAHEINNPTNFVYTGTHNLANKLKKLNQFMYDLAGENVDAEFTEMVEERFQPLNRNLMAISEGSLRIKNIVEDLRTFSRLDEAEQKRIYVTEGIESTLRLIQTKYRRDVEFVCDFQADPQIDCLPSQLNQVFMNIMINACQAIQQKQQETGEMCPGCLSIQTSIAREPTQDSMLAIRFQDNGCGMSEEIKSKIFDPFFTTKKVGEGTGMGLSITYGIIEKHQGRIEVESKFGIGTTLVLYLPLTLDSSNIH